VAVDLTRALEIQGWMEPHELAWLATVAGRSELIIEIGAWKGRSSRVLADHTLGSVVVVDNWCDASEREDLRNEELATRGPGPIEADWRRNMAEHLEAGRVILVRGNSPDVAADVAALATRHQLEPDFIFIDADHSLAGCRADIRAYEVMVVPGGIIAGHDYSTDIHPGVRAAVDEHFGARVRRGPGSIWWVRL
jgi:cephalosporin hydroxylase